MKQTTEIGRTTQGADGRSEEKNAGTRDVSRQEGPTSEKEIRATEQ